jgi:hypothetical protein
VPQQEVGELVGRHLPEQPAQLLVAGRPVGQQHQLVEERPLGCALDDAVAAQQRHDLRRRHVADPLVLAVGRPQRPELGGDAVELVAGRAVGPGQHLDVVRHLPVDLAGVLEQRVDVLVVAAALVVDEARLPLELFPACLELDQGRAVLGHRHAERVERHRGAPGDVAQHPDLALGLHQRHPRRLGAGGAPAHDTAGLAERGLQGLPGAVHLLGHRLQPVGRADHRGVRRDHPRVHAGHRPQVEAHQRRFLGTAAG